MCVFVEAALLLYAAIQPAILGAMQLIGGVLGVLLAAPTALMAAAMAREPVAANAALG